MSDPSGILEDGRHVDDLKVVELRECLSKRGLSKTGNKKELADRLKGFLATGTGEVSDKSTPNSPVKSPINSLIAQYRSTQQQLLKDAHKEPELSENKAETVQDGSGTTAEVNGQQEKAPVELEAAVQKEKTPQKEQTPVKEASPVKEAAKESTPPAEKEEEIPPVQEEKPLEEQIPKAVSPVDRTRSNTPEREVPTNDVKEMDGEEAQSEESPSVVPDRAISEEPAEEEYDKEQSSSPPKEHSAIQQVSDGEDDESRSPTPKPRITAPSEKEERNGNHDDRSEKEGNATSKHPKIEASDKKPEVYTEGIVYVKSDNATAPKPVTLNRKTVSQNDEDRTPEGFIRRVSVSPPRNEPTNFVHIRGLKRPLNQTAWSNILKMFGDLDLPNDEWMDGLKSQAIVRYPTIENAQKCREALHHILWPEGNSSELLVTFTDEEEFIQRKGIIRKTIKVDEEVEPLKKRRTSEKSHSPMQDDLPSPKEPKEGKRERREEADDEGPSRKKKKEVKPLDEIFMKTKTEPVIYFLPLSDEEIARKQAQKAVEKRETKE